MVILVRLPVRSVTCLFTDYMHKWNCLHLWWNFCHLLCSNVNTFYANKVGPYYYFTVVAYQFFIENSHILQLHGGYVLVTYICNMMFYAVLHINFIICWFTKYPLTPLHKDAIIGGLKRFNHFRRGSLSGSVLIL